MKTANPPTPLTGPGRLTVKDSAGTVTFDYDTPAGSLRNCARLRAAAPLPPATPTTPNTDTFDSSGDITTWKNGSSSYKNTVTDEGRVSQMSLSTTVATYMRDYRGLRLASASTGPGTYLYDPAGNMLE